MPRIDVERAVVVVVGSTAAGIDCDERELVVRLVPRNEMRIFDRHRTLQPQQCNRERYRHEYGEISHAHEPTNVPDAVCWG